MVSNEGKIMVCRDFDDTDIKAVIWYIGNDKVSGSDGYISQFFKDNWSIIGNDVCIGVLDFFKTGKLLK